MRKRLYTTLATAAVAAATLLPTHPAAAGIHHTAQPATQPTRILILGDSTTHGSVGDYTWRYRLWNNLQAAGQSVDFVGPRRGVLNDAGTPDPADDNLNDVTGYVDPNFDTDHAAKWGMSFYLPEIPYAKLMADYTPDVVVEDLGINDFAWLHATPQQVASAVESLVKTLRASNPEVLVVLSQIPHTWIAGTVQYNVLLTALAARLDTPTSRVVVAEAPSPWVQGIDTYDIAHPTAVGEVRIARSVAYALNQLGLDPAPEAFPEVVNGPAAVPVLSVVAVHAGMRLAWSKPLGATGEYLWRRVQGGVWDRVPSSWTVPRPPVDAVWQFRVQAFKGEAVSPRFSNTVTVVGGPRR